MLGCFMRRNFCKECFERQDRGVLNGLVGCFGALSAFDLFFDCLMKAVINTKDCKLKLGRTCRMNFFLKSMNDYSNLQLITGGHILP